MDTGDTSPRRSRRKIKEFPITKLIPNLLTISGLCFGMSAIRYALDGRWELSVSLLVAAAIVDGMDGRVARLLNSTSTFGAQLDSLADFISFGVAPGIVMYLWSMHDIKGIGWAVALFYAVCCALRLARFNTALTEEKKEAWKQKFFVGVPSPAGALLCLFPLVITLQFGIPFHPLVVMAYVVTIALMMSSRIPTFAAKQIRVRHDYVLPVLIGAGVLIGCLIIEPWLGLCIVGAGYLVTIVFSVKRYKELERQHNAPGVMLDE